MSISSIQSRHFGLQCTTSGREFLVRRIRGGTSQIGRDRSCAEFCGVVLLHGWVDPDCVEKPGRGAGVRQNRSEVGGVGIAQDLGPVGADLDRCAVVNRCGSV